MIHLLDSNFFIEAYRNHYPMDVAVGFWNKLIDLAKSGVVISIDKVREELYQNQDALTDWCSSHLDESFFQPSDTCIDQYTKVANWASSRSTHYTPAAIAQFLHADEADAWLISKALSDAGNAIIVTHERSRPEMKAKIKIPEPCNQLGVKFITPMDMFRSLRVTF